MGLAVARSLHRRGVRVVVATVAAEETPVSSRAIARFVAFGKKAADPHAFGVALRELIAEERVDLVIPVTDLALRCLAPHVADFRGRTVIACPPERVIACVLDKAATVALATRLGVPTARNEVWVAEPCGATAPASLAFPLFAKSCAAGTDVAPVRARVDHIEALRALGAAAPGRRFLLEEFMPGDDVGVAMLMRGGRRLAAFQFRALRCTPAEGGYSVLARSEAVDPRMADYAERLLRALNWDGVAQLDFRHDPVTGRVTFLEINARFWGSLAAACAAGVDFPWAIWQLAHAHEPSPQQGYRVGVQVQSLEGELSRLMGIARQSRRGRRRWSLPREALRVAWAACRPDVRGMVWSWRDPWPGVQTASILARYWIHTRWRSLRAQFP